MGKRNILSRKSSVGAAGYASEKSNNSDRSKPSIDSKKPRGNSKTNWSRKSRNSDDSVSSVGSSTKEGGSREGGRGGASPVWSNVSHKSVSSAKGSSDRGSLNDLIDAVTLIKPTPSPSPCPVPTFDPPLDSLHHQVLLSLSLSRAESSTSPLALDSWRNNTSEKETVPVVDYTNPVNHTGDLDMAPVVSVIGTGTPLFPTNITCTNTTPPPLH